jgi:hypothetical protein
LCGNNAHRHLPNCGNRTLCAGSPLKIGRADGNGGFASKPRERNSGSAMNKIATTIAMI